MPLQFPPRVGDIVECDWSRGFVEPEMVKKRLAVIISPRLPHRDRLCHVVPLSTTPPPAGIRYQCSVTLRDDPPMPYQGRVKWAKADMINTVSYDRCNLPSFPRYPRTNRRKYYQERLDHAELNKIKHALFDALGLASLDWVLKP